MFSKDSKYPYFTRTVFNNGIYGYVDFLDKEHLIKGNSIAVGMMGMQFFYMEHDFYAGQFTKTLFPLFDTFDADIALYFISILNLYKTRLKAELVRHFEKFLLNQRILLPIHNQCIAFDFMRRYIATLKAERVATLKAERVATLKAYLQEAGLSNTILTEGELAALDALRQNRVDWKETPVCGNNGAFNVYNTHSILKAQVVPGSGNTPYVGAGESNNSIQSYISISTDLIEKGNSIMIGGKTLIITYQEKDYASNDSHNLALYYKDDENPSRAIQLFLVSTLYSALKPKYHWGDSISNKKIKSDTFMMPINNDGMIDYNFINNLISAQIKLCIKDVLSAKDLEISTTEKLIEEDRVYCEEPFYPSIAAETFEIYQWPAVSCERERKTDTILLGCWRDNKHLEWILSNGIYNIRLGKRKGSAEDKPECFRHASLLYLYNLKHPEIVSMFKIVDHQEKMGSELKEMGYPRKYPGKSYMTFKIEMVENKENESHIDIADIISSLPNHINGAPVFIEPDDR